MNRQPLLIKNEKYKHMKKSTDINFFENFKPQIPTLASSEAYGRWFALCSEKWEAKQLAVFNRMHVEQILDVHKQVSQIASAIFAQRSLKDIFTAQYNKAAHTPSRNDWGDMLNEMARQAQKANQWDTMEGQRYIESQMALERQKFFKGFFEVVKNKDFGVQHMWLFDVGRSDGKECDHLLSLATATDLKQISQYPWSSNGYNSALRKICATICENKDVDFLSQVVQLKMEKPSTLGKMLFESATHSKEKAFVQFVRSAVELGVQAPVRIVPMLMQTDPNSADLIWRILKAAPIQEAQEMTVTLLPNVTNNPAFVAQLLNDPKLTPNCVKTLETFIDKESLFEIFRCMDDSQKDDLLAPLCLKYLNKNKDPSLKKVSEFIHNISNTFPTSEQKIVVLRMFAILVEGKHPQLGALLSSTVLEQIANQPSTIKRKM